MKILVGRTVFLSAFLAMCLPRPAAAGEPEVALVRAGIYAAVGCITAHVRHLGWKACAKNAAGLTSASAVEHGGMRLVATGYHWPGFLVHSLGVSMAENVLDNRRVLSRFRTFYLWGSFGVDFERRRFQPQLLPLRLAATAVIASQRQYQIEWGMTLKTGTPFFLDRAKLFVPTGQHLFGNVIAWGNRWNHPNPLVRSIERRSIGRHEMLHALQYRRARICNSVLDANIYRRDHSDGPLSFGQDACTFFMLWNDEEVNRGFEGLIGKDIIEELRGRF